MASMENKSPELKVQKSNNDYITSWQLLVKRMFRNPDTEMERRNISLRRKANCICIEISPPDAKPVLLDQILDLVAGSELSDNSTSSCIKVSKIDSLVLKDFNFTRVYTYTKDIFHGKPFYFHYPSLFPNINQFINAISCLF